VDLANHTPFVPQGVPPVLNPKQTAEPESRKSAISPSHPALLSPKWGEGENTREIAPWSLAIPSGYIYR